MIPKKMGILRITPACLHAILRLPAEITLERIFEDPPDTMLNGDLAFYLVLSGETLPGEPCTEGQVIPRIYAESDGHGTSSSWTFRLV